MGRLSLALATDFWNRAAERDAVAAAFSFIWASARSWGVPARFMMVVVAGAAPGLKAAPRNALNVCGATGGRRDRSLLVAAAKDAPGLW